MQALLPSLITGAREIYTDIPSNAKPQSSFARMIFGSSPQADDSISGMLQKQKVKPLRDHMNELRVTKSDAEVANLRKAGQASGRAFTEAMRSGWTNEKDLETFIEYGFKAYGCEESAYVPVVAGGQVCLSVVALRLNIADVCQNACQIHYVRNDATLE